MAPDQAAPVHEQPSRPDANVEPSDAHSVAAAIGLPFSMLLGLFAGLAVYATSKGHLHDVDLYWHLLAGEELSAGLSANSLGLDWALLPGSATWTSTQWLTELLLYQLHSVGGWAAVAGLRVFSAAVAIAVLSATTLRHRQKALAGLPFMISVAAVSIVSQERPQQATLIGAAALGGTLAAGLVHARLPRWYLIAPATAIWANLHGGWVLVPGVLGLLALGRLIDGGRLRDPFFVRALALSGLAAVSGLLTPAGLDGITAVRRFSRAADGLAEWGSTQPAYSLGIFTTLMLLLLATGWARSASKIPRSEVLAGLVCLILAWTAWRNVAPGLALLAPMTAHRLCTSFPNVGRPEPRWSVPVGIGLATALTLLSLAGLSGREHLPTSTKPVGLASLIAGMDSGQRVLNNYRLAGLVLYFGGPDTKVAIDGRADRYGAASIRAYLDLMDLQGDWQGLLEEVNPTVALIEEDTALAHLLEAERGWEIAGTENGYVLLTPPAGSQGSRSASP